MNESLYREIVDGVLYSLFPRAQREGDNPNGSVDFESIPFLSITGEELVVVLEMMRFRKTIACQEGFW